MHQFLKFSCATLLLFNVQSLPVAVPACIIGCQGTAAACATACIASGVFVPACEAGCVLVYSGCVAGCGSACFHPTTHVRTETGSVDIAGVQIGQRVSTLAHGSDLTTTTLTNVEILFGKFYFREFSFDNSEKKLAVTTDHVVIANSKVVEASCVQPGDVMFLVDDTGLVFPSNVTGIREFIDMQKVKIETADSTAIANGVFTTVVCDGYQRGIDSELQDFFQTYKDHHLEVAQEHEDFKKNLFEWYS